MAESQEQTSGDTPPAGRTGTKGTAGRKGASAKVVEGLTGIYALLGTFAYMGNQYDGTVILQKSKEMAETLEAVARGNPEMYRVLIVLTKSGSWLPLAMAYGGVAYAISANHGLVPSKPVEIFGLPTPPERAEQAQQEPSQDGGPAPVYGYAPEYVPPDVAYDTSTNAAQTTPGLHIPNMDLIRQEAMRKALAEYNAAQHAGEDGMPAVNPGGAL